MGDMHVQVVDKPEGGQKLVIEIDMETPSRKEEGAMFLVSKSGGFRRSGIKLSNGKEIVVNTMAGFYPDDYVRGDQRKKNQK